jgi:hypothetical protein
MIALHSPYALLETGLHMCSLLQAPMPVFGAKFSGRALLSAKYGHVEAYRVKAGPRVRIPLSATQSEVQRNPPGLLWELPKTT